MRVPRTSTGTSTTTLASNGPVRVRKPSALARRCSADGQILAPADYRASPRASVHARNVVIEVTVRHEADVSAGEAGKWEANWDRLVTFAR